LGGAAAPPYHGLVRQGKAAALPKLKNLSCPLAGCAEQFGLVGGDYGIESWQKRCWNLSNLS
jgi:hypothetical protein